MSSPVLSAKSAAAQAYLPLITHNWMIRASKPKGGNAAYVWRMVAFSVSTKPAHQCMPVTADWDVVVPADYLLEAPEDWVAEKVANSRITQSDQFCISRSGDGTVAGYFRETVWKTFSTDGRRKHYTKHVLDVIVKDIVDSVPVTHQPGTMRWARAFGVA